MALPGAALAALGFEDFRRVSRFVRLYFGLGLLQVFVTIWVVVKIMVPFWVLIIIRHLLFRVPKKGP